MKWEYVRADEFCISVRDGTHDTPKQTESGYKLVTGKHIKDGQINPTDAYYISEQDYKAINERSLVEQWDVLMSMIGTVGEAAVVKNIPNYAIKNVALFKCGGSELKGRWINYYLHSPNAQGHMSGNQKGSSQQFLSLKQLRGMLVPITDELYMQRVIDVLSTYDNLIENNQKQINLLEEAAQRLYKEWFVRDTVPDGWHMGTLKELISINYGKDHKKAPDNGDIPVYGSGGLMRKCNQSLFSGEAVLIPRKGSLNHIMYVNEEFWTVDTMFYATMKNLHTALFVYFFLKGHDMYSMNTGAAVPSMTIKILDAMDILIPCQDVLERFDRIAQVYFKKIAILRKQDEKLQEARDRLLPKLMSGEIEV